MDFDYVVVDSVIISGSVALSLTLAELLQLQRPYWVPVSCLAILQGANLRMMGSRHVQRLLGTMLGLGLAWVLLALPLDKWSVVVMIIVLFFVIEVLVVRHYALAVVFITPLTIFLADFSNVVQQSPLIMMQARALDIVIGSSCGLLGGAALHLPALRSRVKGGIRTVLPVRR